MTDEEKGRRRGLTFDEAWAEYFAANPEVVACWGHQNGRMPMGYRDSDLGD